MSKNTNERIEGINSKIEQLENERKRLMNLQKQADRKARTKRLIERGAILESLITDPANFTNEQIKTFLEKTIATETSRKILAGMIAQKPDTQKTVDSKWRAKQMSTAPGEKQTQMTMGTD